jgi:hypothetical protein
VKKCTEQAQTIFQSPLFHPACETPRATGETPDVRYSFPGTKSDYKKSKVKEKYKDYILNFT